MDLERFIANRDVLERLSREYELLKASGANVDYPAWVRQRLREAAAEISTAALGLQSGNAAIDNSHRVEPEVGGAGTFAAGAQQRDDGPRTAGQAAVGSQVAATRAPKPEQLSFNRIPGAHSSGRLPRPQLETEGGSSQSETAWFMQGEGTGSASQALTTAIYGPSMPGAGPALTQPAKGARRQKRVVIVSPRKSPAQLKPSFSPKKQQVQQAPVSKLYTRAESGLFAMRPDAYVHPEARPRRTPLAAKRPDWVNAASLQAALRGSSSAVPHLQAAAERERRLAVSSALARQTLAAGLGPDEARAVALYGISPAAASAQYDHVLQVAQQLAQQNEQLALAVQLNSAQLAQQQALLESTLHQRPSDTAREESPAADTAPAARIDVESGPPPWFLRRAPVPATRGRAAGGPSSKPGRSSSKSPKKPTSRPRSPPLPSLAVTAKERERTSRKESLKALLKQVLGNAGLAGGQEGRRRLASGMAEAEKLVAAIQALTRSKAGPAARARDANQDAPGHAMISVTIPSFEGTATQTSGRASADGAGAAGGAAADAGAKGRAGASRSASRAQSIGRARSEASLDGAPGGRPRSPGVSRAISVQGSSLAPMFGSSQSLDGEGPLTKAGPLDGAAQAGPGPGGPTAPGARPRKVASSSDTSREGLDTTDSQSSLEQEGRRTAAPRTAPPGHPAAAEAPGRPATAPAAPPGYPAAAEPPPGGSPAPRVISVPAAGYAPQPGRAGVAAARGAPPGFMVESLEDQVQQIVERDAASFAEMARLRKIDTLEQRLHSMVDKVETKLARVVFPHKLTAQQLQQAGLLGPGEAEPRFGPDSQPLSGSAAAAGGQYGAAGGPGGAGAYGGGAGAYGVAIVSPRSAGLSVLELQRMLIQLNRMESQEQEVRRRWFFDAKGPRQRAPIGQPIVVHDGQLGTLDPDDPGLPLASPGRTASPNTRAGYWSFARPPTESALATVAADSTRSTLSGPHRGRGVVSSLQAQDGTAAADESLSDPISDALLESVTRGRRRFLRAQKLADGDLMAAAKPSLNPVQIMEDVTDALLDEMLREQAKEMYGLCDSLGEHMVKAEFENSDDDENQRARQKSPPRDYGVWSFEVTGRR